MFGKLIELFSSSPKEGKSAKKGKFFSKTERSRFLAKKTYNELFSILEKRTFELVDLPMFDREVKVFYLNYFNSLFKIIKFYHKKFDTWDKTFKTSFWVKPNNPRLEKLKNFEYHLISTIILIESRNGDEETLNIQTKDAAYRQEISKILMLHLFLLFDGYCYSFWKYLNSAKISTRENIRIESNKFFVNNYTEEFEKYNSVTKNIIVDFFFSQLNIKDISPSFITIFKILIKWRISLNKAISGFPDGDLMDLPVLSADDIATRQAKHLAAFLRLRIDDFRYSPAVFNDYTYNIVDGHQIFIPNVIDNPNNLKVLDIEGFITNYRKMRDI